MSRILALFINFWQLVLRGRAAQYRLRLYRRSRLGNLGLFYQNESAHKQTHRTPNLDRLGQNGLQMRAHYCPAPVGAPSRSSLLTGDFIEPGTFRTGKLRRLPRIEMFKWNAIFYKMRVESDAAKPKRDRMRLALHYQALLDTGEFESRAALARRLGVSRARVTHILNRLNSTEDESTRSRFADTGYLDH